MNSFQILDKDNNAIPIDQLDKEVCELVGVEQDTKYYCVLGKRSDYPEGSKGNWKYLSSTANWYDSIGWMIASDNKSFQDIINHYTEPMKEFIGKKDEDGTIITIEYIYPYHMKVLNSWIDKGYQPKQVIE